MYSESLNWSLLKDGSNGGANVFVHHVKFHIQYKIDSAGNEKGKILM